MLTALLLAAAAPAFDPLRFFAGRTRGEGELKVALRRHIPVLVRGNGRVEPDGSLALEQVVSEGDKPPRTRGWLLRRTAPGRYEGMLTDARGPVNAEADGAVLRLRFTTASGFRVRQRLVVPTDGRSAANVLTASRFGVTVAKLREPIVKVD